LLLRIRTVSKSLIPNVLVLNSGIPGRTAHKGSIEWVEDACALPPTLFLRLELAQQLGLHSVCAVPVIASKPAFTICVLVLWSSEARKEEHQFLALMQETVERMVPRVLATLDRSALLFGTPSMASTLPSLHALDLPRNSIGSSVSEGSERVVLVRLLYLWFLDGILTTRVWRRESGAGWARTSCAAPVRA
jgi:hypothetical protein